jgi:glycosyltransferase involved in cell wall biosynthesis
LKIGLLHYAVPPVVGGVESVLAQHARMISEAGHTVLVIAAQGQAWRDDIEFISLPLVGSRHPQILETKASLDRGQISEQFGSLVDELVLQLQSVTQGMDVLIAHNVCSLNKNLVLTAALHRLNGTLAFPRLILWHHDLAWTTDRYRHELHEGYPWDLLRTDWPGVTQVVVSTLRQTELAELMGIPLGRVQVIPNGVEIAAFLKLESQTIAWIKHLDLLKHAPLLLLPVRITPRKNLEMGLRILFHLRKHFPSAGILVTGPLGAHNSANQVYFSDLIKLRNELKLTSSAHFLAEFSDDYLADVIIADFYRLANAVLLPSIEEGFGIPLIEAALSQRPVFCTNLAPFLALGLADVQYFSVNDDPQLVAARIFQTLQADPVYRFATRTRQQYTWEQIYIEKIAPLFLKGFAQLTQEEGSK